ncbi:hypothetical protein Anas_08626 [Armadillidium nasatum]|uniref:Single domain-containing protein n=1 Tax=Armadillidium nasatum TaxID=96803 RepID=A0A5N5TGH8_9CRUS|nr:hypothetical protein Anas_08626 [Armadillidium nasatum]
MLICDNFVEILCLYFRDIHMNYLSYLLFCFGSHKALLMACSVIKLFILLCFLYEAKGWVATIPLVENEGYPGKCYYTKDDGTPLILDIGETFIPPPPECHEMVCSKFGEEYAISLTGCGSVGAPEGCEVIRDESATYPECCQPRFRCE